jgi:3-carboxy-cis,cis-muconate cycloisomerase
MPQKQNPVTSAVLLAAATRVPPLVNTMLSAMIQQHERALGAWHAEWEVLAEICTLTGGALSAVAHILPGLRVDTTRMLQNVSLSKGSMMAESISMALAAKIGRDEAYCLVKAAALASLERNTTLAEQLQGDARITAHLSIDEIDRLLDPQNCLGSSAAFIGAVLARFEATFDTGLA